MDAGDAQVHGHSSFRRRIHALRIPVRSWESCRLVALPLTAAAFSDVIGGGLLDEACYGGPPGQGFCLYLDEGRAVSQFPYNRRAAELLDALGCDPDPVDVRGTALITGTSDTGDDADVPAAVLRSAHDLRMLSAVG